MQSIRLISGSPDLVPDVGRLRKKKYAEDSEVKAVEMYQCGVCSKRCRTAGALYSMYILTVVCVVQCAAV